jgi:hypoxanthine-DNA glycosylase
MEARGFPPIASRESRVLVLGSMPGLASLAAQQYYAHPRNAFWPIMGELFGATPELPYPLRVARLLDAGVAVWDVLGACVRPGSLDSDIQSEGLVVNDFGDFLDGHPQIGQVFFNGAKAEQLFQSLALPQLPVGLQLKRLPSTSPANAGMRLAQKIEAWRCVAGAELTGAAPATKNSVAINCRRP